ncbi:hypothetical protein, partial [Nocardia farcinica]|uniref:hypothetical protein n=1 Tax=Nocardia farcinica TaxID=37329 RepID=UPI002455B4BE
MTDREAPGPPEAGKRTVRDQLRRKLDELKPARNDPARGAEEPSTVVRVTQDNTLGGEVNTGDPGQ